MKKPIIYAMLCSAPMFSGTLLAADGQDHISKEAEERRQKIMQSAPHTPDIKSQISQKYPSSQYTPSSQKILVEMEVNKVRRKRDKILAEELDQVHAYEVSQRLELAKKQEEQKREEERIKQEDLLKKYSEVIEKEKAAAAQKQEENKSLDKKIEGLDNEVKELGEKYKKAQMLKQATVEELEEISQELEVKTKELSATKQKLRSAETEAAMAQLKIDTEQKARMNLEAGLQNIIGGTKDLSSSGVSALPVEVTKNASNNPSSSVSNTSSAPDAGGSGAKKKTLPKANLS